jgi:hypothetical protein
MSDFAADCAPMYPTYLSGRILTPSERKHGSKHTHAGGVGEMTDDGENFPDARAAFMWLDDHGDGSVDLNFGFGSLIVAQYSFTIHPNPIRLRN